MSVESGASTQGASAPSFSGEGFSPSPSFAPSFSSPNAETGGSFAPGLNITSLFSETTPFAPSLGKVQEGPVKNEAFANLDWSTLAHAAKSPESPFSEKAGFEQMILEDVASFEKQIEFKPNEFSIVAENKQTEALPVSPLNSLLKETKPLEVAYPEFDKAIEMNPSEWAIVAKPKREADVKETVNNEEIANREQMDRVAVLLVETGLYRKDEAEKRVNEIVQNVSFTKAESIVDELVSLPEAQEEIVKTPSEALVTFKEEDEEEEEEKAKKTVLEEDKKAQGSRKQTAREKISALFERARGKGDEKVSGEEIARELSEKQEQKSELLKQVGLGKLPDGSLDEALKDVERLEDFEDVSLDGEINATGVVEDIFDANMAVRITDSDLTSSKPATYKEAEKVLKFTNLLKLAA